MTEQKANRFRFEQMTPDGTAKAVGRELAEEVPIAIEFNGIGYAVLMATPSHIDELVLGFALAERLIGPEDAPLDVDTHATEQGIIARATLPEGRTPALLDRVRLRASDSSCGMCGIESLEQALRPLPSITATSRANKAAIFRALGDLGQHQPLNGRTGAVHAAALVSEDGAIQLVREDVGRHNAFDKLIGAMRRRALDWNGGFALLSSRCSYELVEKAILANCPMLVTISAPTQLAIQCAAGAGLPLIVLARSDALLVSDSAPNLICPDEPNACGATREGKSLA